MPVSARPRIASGPSGSVLVDGRRCSPATDAGAAVRAEGTGVAAVAAVVGVTLAAAVATGVAVSARLGDADGAGVKVVIGAGTGVGLAPGAMVNGGRVGGVGVV